MARADAETLAKLSSLLEDLREIEGLAEIKPGIFYVRRLPMLHFHADEDGIVADLKCVSPKVGGFDRFPVNTGTERRALIKEAVHRCAHLVAPKR